MGLEAVKLELMEWLSDLDDQETIEILVKTKKSREQDSDFWESLTEEEKNEIYKGFQSYCPHHNNHLV